MVPVARTFVRRCAMVACASLSLVLVGSASVSAQTPTPTPAVRVSAIDNLLVNPYDGGATTPFEDDICVFNNSATGNYWIRFTTGTGSFVISSGGNTVPFTLRFKDAEGDYQNVTYGTELPGENANTSSDFCGGVPNATYEVTIPQANLLSVRPGTYEADLSIEVRPR